jgi:hypothetical protein
MISCCGEFVHFFVINIFHSISIISYWVYESIEEVLEHFSMMIGACPAELRFAKYPAAKLNVEMRKMMPQKINRLFFILK